MRISIVRRLSAALLASVVLASALVGPVSAFELFGVKIFGGKTPADETDDVIGEPVRYDANFAVKSDDQDLEDKLKGASTLWKDREAPASGASGLLAKARGDYRRLLAALYSEGRYGGSISIKVDGREAADLPPDAELAMPAAVTIDIDSGPVFVFGETTIANEAPATADRRDRVKLPSEERFAPGEVARSGTILQAERLVIEAWRQQGHAKAAMADRRVQAAHDRDIVDATLTAKPGPIAYYAPVQVEGSERVDAEWLAWMTGLIPGHEYDPDDLERATKRLARLDLFRAMRFQEGDAIGDDGLLPISLIVQERMARRFGLGASYSTLDGAGFETYWLHRNLFGRAERLRIEAKIAGIGNTLDPRDFTYRLGATFIKPGVYTPDTDFVASLIGDREVLEPYTRTSVNADIGFTHIFSDELSGRAAITGGASQFDDVFGRRKFVSAGVLGAITYDGRDNKTDATEGFFGEAVLEPFYEFNYGNFAGRMTVEGRAYHGFGAENRVVLAGRVKIGTIVGPPISEIAPDKLFFAGGGGSVRGYAYRNIGLASPSGGVVGGRSLIEGSAELRFKATQTIGVVGFVDAGYVGANSIPKFSEDLRVGAGVGLRYLTGLGPIRLDVAVPLDRRANDPSLAFYVGIGQAF